MLLALQLNNLLESAPAVPPVFSGPVANISEATSSGTHSYDIGAYFTLAVSYAIAPAVEAGWTFDTGTGELVIDTDVIGVFGTYVVTATNANGSTDSNAFSVAVVADDVQATGGWLFLNQYESEKQRRRARDRKRRELEEETDRIEDQLDRQIGQLLRKQEAIDEKRDDFKRIAELAKTHADIEAAREYSERVAVAFKRVIEKGNYSAIEALEREIERAKDEESFLVSALMLLANG